MSERIEWTHKSARYLFAGVMTDRESGESPGEQMSSEAAFTTSAQHLLDSGGGGEDIQMMWKRKSKPDTRLLRVTCRRIYWRVALNATETLNGAIRTLLLTVPPPVGREVNRSRLQRLSAHPELPSVR